MTTFDDPFRTVWEYASYYFPFFADYVTSSPCTALRWYCNGMSRNELAAVRVGERPLFEPELFLYVVPVQPYASTQATNTGNNQS